MAALSARLPKPIQLTGGASRIMPDLPSLERSDASYRLSLAAFEKEELLDMLQESIVAYEGLAQVLAQAQASGDEAMVQLDAVAVAHVGTGRPRADPPAEDPPTKGTSNSAAIDRARAGNAMGVMERRLHDAQAELAAVKHELELERARRIQAEEKVESIKVAWSDSGRSSVGEPGALIEPSGSEAERPPSLRDLGGSSASVEQAQRDLERMQIDLRKELGQPRTPGQFVQNAVAGALAGTAQNAVKLLNNIMPRSPDRSSPALGISSSDTSFESPIMQSSNSTDES